MALYDKIGIGYDNFRKADPYITSRLLSHNKPVSSRRCLDLACGSGNYTIALKKANVNISGIDISEHMLHLAQHKSPSINWILGYVLRDDSVLWLVSFFDYFYGVFQKSFTIQSFEHGATDRIMYYNF
jgi:SAM-dependent methyltransferase